MILKKFKKFINNFECDSFNMRHTAQDKIENILHELKNLDTMITIDTLAQILNDESEFMYYSDAMDYMQEQDQTLTYFLEAAGELGFNLKDMNSCQLASIGLYKELEDALQPVFQVLEQD